MKKDQLILLVLLAFTLVLVLYFGFESRFTLYVVLAALVIAVCVVAMSSEFGKLDLLWGKEKPRRVLSPKEKEVVLYYVLNGLKNKKSVNAADLAFEVGLQLPELLPLLKYLEQRNVLKVLYPPMQTSPVIVEGDSIKSHEFRDQLKSSLLELKVSKDKDFQTAIEEEVIRIKDSFNRK